MLPSISVNITAAPRQTPTDRPASEATVATHVRHIFEKTGSANRVEAANWAREHGVV